MRRNFTTREFVVKAKRIHGEKYNYSLVNYINSRTKVNIICPLHGIFTQIPNQHLRKHGCKKCYWSYKSSTTSDFIAKATRIHKGKYSYLHSKYVANDINVMVTCPMHGDFTQLPSNHLNGEGCKKCSWNIPSTKEFKLLAKKIHGEFYNYDKFVYNGSKKRGIIICPKHGEFFQCPSNHLNGKGCLKCGFERSASIVCSKAEVKFLDYIRIDNRNRQKFIHGYIVDGYDSNTNTIYEFLGNYWHGNPKTFQSHVINKLANKTFGELYQNTLKRLNNLKNYDYDVRYIWEDDWNRFENGEDKEPKILCL